MLLILLHLHMLRNKRIFARASLEVLSWLPASACTVLLSGVESFQLVIAIIVAEGVDLA
jgi:hypothetical protein